MMGLTRWSSEAEGQGLRLTNQVHGVRDALESLGLGVRPRGVDLGNCDLSAEIYSNVLEIILYLHETYLAFLDAHFSGGDVAGRGLPIPNPTGRGAVLQGSASGIHATGAGCGHQQSSRKNPVAAGDGGY